MKAYPDFIFYTVLFVQTSYTSEPNNCIKATQTKLSHKIYFFNSSKVMDATLLEISVRKG